MSNKLFDYAIIGTGAAGLHLALAMGNDPFFAHKKILLLDKDRKERNDRTWCFWEKGDGLWDDLVLKSWEQGDFFHKTHIPFSLQPYRYKMLRGIDFYKFAKRQLATQSQFTWLLEEVKEVHQKGQLEVVTERSVYKAKQVFDSRIPLVFFENKAPHTYLLQHFKGWLIQTPDDQFEDSRFTMMDYRLRWKDTSSFTYVLPINKREALVEFTLFSPSLLKEENYNQMLHEYIGKILKINNFKVLETEQGVIPMSDFPFEKHHAERHLRIGTAGGWVKPSTGYSFKNCERNARKITGNLKAGQPANKGILSPRSRFYDAVFLDVLNRRNAFGPDLFYAMYKKNPIQYILAFLDDESRFVDELKMMAGFPKMLFLKSGFKVMGRFL